MFERYTERARRVLFFARYEATQLGSRVIAPEHLLLGLAREGEGLVAELFASANLSPESLRDAIEQRTTFQERIPTSVEMPFSEVTKRALHQAASEADQLLHGYIGVEHLLLALLREPESIAGAILSERGFGYRETVDQIVGRQNAAVSLPPGPPLDLARSIDQIQALLARLATRLAGDRPMDVDIEVFDLLDRIQRALERLKAPPADPES